MTLSEELNKLAELRERGTLTEEEFTRAKSRLLNAEDTHPTPPFVSAVNTFRRSRKSSRQPGPLWRRTADQRLARNRNGTNYRRPRVSALRIRSPSSKSRHLGPARDPRRR